MVGSGEFAAEKLPPLEEVLRILADCVEMFLEARRRERIQIGPNVLKMGVVVVSQALIGAVQNPDMARHLMDHGLAECERLIATIERRSDRYLRIEDVNRLVFKLEDDGPGI
jgi:hypothetical protein